MSRPLETQKRSYDEVYGLLLLGLGVLLFISLVCFKPEQVPSWFPLSHKAPGGHHHSLNFMGDVGAIVASSSYFFLGAASYLVAATLLGYGGVKLMHSRIFLKKRLPWMTLFILSGACLFELQHWFLKDWAHSMNTASSHTGAGGTIGYWMGRRLFKELLFGPGSFIILGILYLMSLTQMTGINSIELLKKTIILTGTGLIRCRSFCFARKKESDSLRYTIP